MISLRGSAAPVSNAALLTDHGREPHNQEMYARIAELGWLGVAIPGAVRRLRRRRGRHVPAVRGVGARG